MFRSFFIGLAIACIATTTSLAETAVPVGSIVAFAGTVAPAGWLLCDGSVIPADSQYKPLRTLIGSNTPDLRGYFLRGIDPTGRVDPGSKPPNVRKLLSEQADMVGPHVHRYVRHMTSGPGKSGPDSPEIGTDEHGNEATTSPDPPADETRPKNKAVNFIIKATN